MGPGNILYICASSKTCSLAVTPLCQEHPKAWMTKDLYSLKSKGDLVKQLHLKTLRTCKASSKPVIVSSPKPSWFLHLAAVAVKELHKEFKAAMCLAALATSRFHEFSLSLASLAALRATDVASSPFYTLAALDSVVWGASSELGMDQQSSSICSCSCPACSLSAPTFAFAFVFTCFFSFKVYSLVATSFSMEPRMSSCLTVSKGAAHTSPKTSC